MDKIITAIKFRKAQILQNTLMKTYIFDIFPNVVRKNLSQKLNNH